MLTLVIGLAALTLLVALTIYNIYDSKRTIKEINEFIKTLESYEEKEHD